MINQLRLTNRLTRWLIAGGLAAAIALPASLHGLMEVGQGRLDVTLKAKGEHNSNVFANANEIHDLLFTFTPSVEFSQATGLTNIDLRAGVDIIRFDSLGEQDTEDFFVGGSISYPNRPQGIRTQFHADAGWMEITSADEALGERIESNRWHIETGVRSDYSDRLAIRGAFHYSERDYDLHRRFSHEDTLRLSADSVWIYSEKLETFLGYQYREANTEGTAGREPINARDHRVTIGAEGELQPKVTGGVSAGFQARRFRSSDRPSTTRPYFGAHVEWVPTEMSTLILDAEQDFSNTPDDRSINTSTVALTLRQTIGDRMWIDPTVSYQRARYPLSPTSTATDPRRDNRTGFSIGLNAEFAHDITGRIGYSYLDSDSNRAFFDYERHLYEISAAVRF